MTESDTGDADASYRAWLAEVFAHASGEAHGIPAGSPVFGWHDRTIGGRIDTRAGPRWLRVVVESHAWAGGEFWTGNSDANAITGVAKPCVLDTWEWDASTARVRAEVMTLAPGALCSATPELRAPAPVHDSWWSDLGASLQALAATPTHRVHVSVEELTRRVTVFFGERAEITVTRWDTAHGDLHWANLLQPECVLLDWEGWGVAPAGFDAATLYLHSLLQPDTAEEVRTRMGEVLQSRDGLLAQLYVTARLLLRIERGDYPDLTIPLHRNAEQVLTALAAPR